MSAAPYILWIEELRKEDTEQVGKKCAILGELAAMGARIPPGFAVSVAAWERFMEHTALAGQIRDLLTEHQADVESLAAGERVSRAVRELIEAQSIPDELRDALCQSYASLCERTGMEDVPVAVRSAGAVSMPGAMETYLGVCGMKDLFAKVLRVWSSAYTHRAVLYRRKQNLSLEYAPIGVGVLQLVDAKAAGVLMTANPTSGDTNEIVIESNWGLGESVVSGDVTPDRFNVSKNGLQLTAKLLNRKTKMVVLAGTGAELKETPAELQACPSLSDEEVRALARAGVEIEGHFGGPTDIEWAFSAAGPAPDQPYILQARPMKPLPTYRDPIDKILDMMLK